jgi:hypothetical protein
MQLLAHEDLTLQAAHFPSFDLLMWRTNAQPAYPKIVAPIKIFMIISPTSFHYAKPNNLPP